jgi:hypothetical protein
MIRCIRLGDHWLQSGQLAFGRFIRVFDEAGAVLEKHENKPAVSKSGESGAPRLTKQMPLKNAVCHKFERLLSHDLAAAFDDQQ